MTKIMLNHFLGYDYNKLNKENDSIKQRIIEGLNTPNYQHCVFMQNIQQKSPKNLLEAETNSA